MAGLIFSALSKAILQLNDPRFLKVVLYGVVAAFIILISLSYTGSVVVQFIVGDGFTLPFIGEVSWAGEALGWTSFLGLLLLSSLLMLPVATAVSGLFLDQIAAAVEARHYPELPPARKIPVKEVIQESLRFLGLVLLVNSLGLILYLLFLPFAPFIFLAINGFLLGREYFALVASRRVISEQAKILRKRNGIGIWAAGILVATPLSVPLVNLFVPVIGVACFAHIFLAVLSRSR